MGQGKKESMPATRIRMGKSNRMLSIICYVVVGLFAAVCLFPFALMITSSFMTEKEIVSEGYKLIPKEWTAAAYTYLLDNPKKLLDAYKTTILITVVGTVLGLVIMSMAGYVLNRKDFKYRGFFSFMIYFTTLFSGGLVPTYILYVRYLNLKDNIWAMILPGLVSAWSIFLMRNFMKSIPDELYESATMDGAGPFTIYLKIFMPLAIPSLATVGLFLALGYWNEWYNASLYIDTASKYPLQYYLAEDDQPDEHRGADERRACDRCRYGSHAVCEDGDCRADDRTDHTALSVRAEILCQRTDGGQRKRIVEKITFTFAVKVDKIRRKI